MRRRVHRAPLLYYSQGRTPNDPVSTVQATVMANTIRARSRATAAAAVIQM